MCVFSELCVLGIDEHWTFMPLPLRSLLACEHSEQWLRVLDAVVTPAACEKLNQT